MSTGAAAVFIENTLPFTILSFICFVACPVDSDTAYFLKLFYIMFTRIPPLMIALLRHALQERREDRALLAKGAQRRPGLQRTRLDDIVMTRRGKLK
ncbi:uncharacterized protein BXZ73DRAFT_104655 [Epithele typhae]|uniref:uncharacterized protein n=1 Tax=Epithele typhae TaxID=378194 RepID=UPI002007D91A|nr:uncharacterized protein BXZ73DRAFT_104655 [Epithele typhae]KAH9920530.1 hypothetical protein BXZ73DRAFT_104655 [Epithele typhae]